MNRAIVRSALVGAALALTLPACSPVPDDDEAAAAVETNDTVAEALAAEEDFSVIAGVLKETGVAGVFDGPGSYTVLAPTDDAMGGVLDAENDASEEERQVVLIALLRKQILPGQITTDAIRQAIADGEGTVEMRTLSDGLVTFALDGETITVTGGDGEPASLGQNVIQAGNGSIIPLTKPIASLPDA